MPKKKKVVHGYLVLNLSLIKESHSVISILLKVECSELCIHKVSAMAPQPRSPASKPHLELQERMPSKQ